MSWLALLLIAWLVGLWWWTSLKRRERAQVLGRNACQRAGVQFLDETVAMKGLRIIRRRGRRYLAFDYGFDFSADGIGRRSGTLTLVRYQPFQIHLDLEERSVSIVEGEQEEETRD